MPKAVPWQEARLRLHGHDHRRHDVVRENNQTYRLGWSEQCKDGTKMGVGCPEYVLLFRKPQTDRTRGYADLPVAKSKTEYTRAHWQVDAHAFWRSSGNRQLTAEEMPATAPPSSQSCSPSTAWPTSMTTNSTSASART